MTRYRKAVCLTIAVGSFTGKKQTGTAAATGYLSHRRIMKIMGVTTTDYETDFVEWTARMARLLREGRFDEVDLEHVAEEIEDLGRSERLAVRSQSRRMLSHLIKIRIQPERAGASWRGSIVGARIEILDHITDSPSLRRHAETNLQRIYCEAVELALAETNLSARAKELDIPPKCPYTLDELLEGNLDNPA